MDLGEIIRQLREEHRLLSEAIERLEMLESDRRDRTDQDGIRRRGRPPGSRNKPRGTDSLLDGASGEGFSGSDELQARLRATPRGPRKQ